VELTIGRQSEEPSSIRLVATLAVAGMLSGFLLATTYQTTKPIIDANKAREMRQGVLKVVPGSEVVQKLALRDGALVAVDESEKIAEPFLFAAYDGAGAFRGYGIVNEGAGFQDQIRLLYGYDPVRERVVGMHILSSRETPGLGDKIFKDAEFVGNFGDLATGPEIVVVKDGRDTENEVDAITGATISSKAVVRIINEANAFWVEKLPAPGTEPPAPSAAPIPAPGEGGGP
jgi:electron transport complex protein RnfG